MKVAVKHDSVELPRMIRVDEDFLSLLGIYVSEGYARKTKDAYQVAFCNKKLEKDVVRFARKLFGVKVWVGDEEQTICSCLVYKLFTEYLKCGKNCASEAGPGVHIFVTYDESEAFPASIFRGDGSVSLASTLEVNCTSVSELLLRDLEFLLSRFGIETSWGHDRKVNRSNGVVGEFYKRKGIRRIDDSFKLRMYAENAKAFCQQIGFYAEKNRKAKRLSSVQLHVAKPPSRSDKGGESEGGKVPQKPRSLL